MQHTLVSNLNFFLTVFLSHHDLLIVTTDNGRVEGTNRDVVIHYDKCDVDLLYSDNDSWL
jgi:hypothetical protein